MKMQISTKPDKNPNSIYVFRNILLVGIAAIFLFITIIFLYQYRQYQRIEQEVEEMYGSPLGTRPDDQLPGLEHLYQLLGETDLIFRLFTVDFDDTSYMHYRIKLDTVKMYIDSLFTRSLGEDSTQVQGTIDFETRERFATEFAVLKRNMDQLITDNDDENNPLLSDIGSASQTDKTVTIIDQLTEEVANAMPDTIVRKRESLFRRVFRAKNDTIIVNTDAKTPESTGRMEVIRERISNSLGDVDRQHQSQIQRIRSTFRQLQDTERQLILTNFELLDSLRAGIDNLRAIGVEMVREEEARNFSLYRSNTDVFRYQLIFAIALMLVMIALLFYYQRRVTDRERKLVSEVDYSKRLADQKTSMLASVSHEIRTPLNALLNAAEMIRNQEIHADDQERKTLRDSAYYNIQMINNTINDILNINLIEEGKLPGNEQSPEFYSPWDMVTRVLMLHENQALLKKQEIVNRFGIDRRLQVLGQSFKVSQILSNLLGNAIKYTGKGGTITLTTSLNREKGRHWLAIDVRDTGIGVDPEKLNDLFRKYYTVNSTTGFGLGLYIVKKMIDSMSGEIVVDSIPGKGTVFHVRIPAEDTRLNTSMDLDLNEPPLQRAALPAGLRLLIIDDNPINLLYIKQFLKGTDVVIYEAYDIRSAMDILASKPTDVVITDIHLPDLTGWDLLAHIRGNEQWAQMGVIATTASTEPVTTDGDLSFDGVLAKPFTENELIRTILHGIDRN